MEYDGYPILTYKPLIAKITVKCTTNQKVCADLCDFLLPLQRSFMTQIIILWAPSMTIVGMLQTLSECHCLSAWIVNRWNPVDRAMRVFLLNGHTNAVSPQKNIKVSAGTALETGQRAGISVFPIFFYPWVSLEQLIELKHTEGVDRVVTWQIKSNSNNVTSNREQQGENMKPDHWLVYPKSNMEIFIKPFCGPHMCFYFSGIDFKSDNSEVIFVSAIYIY